MYNAPAARTCGFSAIIAALRASFIARRSTGLEAGLLFSPRREGGRGLVSSGLPADAVPSLR